MPSPADSRFVIGPESTAPSTQKILLWPHQHAVASMHLAFARAVTNRWRTRSAQGASADAKTGAASSLEIRAGLNECQKPVAAGTTTAIAPRPWSAKLPRNRAKRSSMTLLTQAEGSWPSAIHPLGSADFVLLAHASSSRGRTKYRDMKYF